MKSPYECPVCGYDALLEPPADYNVCPCCGTEFGYHDLVHSWSELRANWLAKGANWFSSYTHPPYGWNPMRQIQALVGLEVLRVTKTDSSVTELRAEKTTVAA